MGQKQLQRLTAEFDKPQSGLWYQPAKAETSDPALIDDLANKLDAMLLNAVPHLQHSWQLISQLSDNNLSQCRPQRPWLFARAIHPPRARDVRFEVRAGCELLGELQENSFALELASVCCAW
mmetsp:Transcript_4376/g.8354  ORF Transcript_4376/g.8354 Transcript_4376/m.8354 type:complete len:122 (+) Transcript_4376:167-532(+)